MTNSKVIIALDFKSKEETLEFLDKFGDEKLYVKVGMEAFYGQGIDLITEMEAWKADKANAYALNSPYQSESKADYSYTLKSGADGSGKNSGASALINQFAGRLSRWRKL